MSGLLREKFQYRDFTFSWWWIALTGLFVPVGYNVVNKRYNKIHLSAPSWERGVTQLPLSGEILLAVKWGFWDLHFLTECQSFESCSHWNRFGSDGSISSKFFHQRLTHCARVPLVIRLSVAISSPLLPHINSARSADCPRGPWSSVGDYQPCSCQIK